MELLVLGERPAEYIGTAADYLNQCGVYCGVTRTAAEAFTLEIDDYLQPPFQIDCVCEELDPLNVMGRVGNLAAFRDVPNVVNISSVKWFPEFRYNVDENWWGIDQWVGWDVYWKKTRSAFPAAKFGWVFSGAEKIFMSSRFFQDEENAAALRLSLQPLRGTDIPELMERFFTEIGEERFLQGIRGSDDTAGFLFSPGADVNLNRISEKTNIYWALYSFLQTSGPKSQKVYESLFTAGAGTAP